MTNHMLAVMFELESDWILNYLIPPFAIANQSSGGSDASIPGKQGELQGFAVSVVILQPKDMRLHFLVLRWIAFHSVVIALTNRVWDIKSVFTLSVHNFD